uniref:Uncharacterized protein n=1 Tax=Mus musculus TaxID=10090 RepID=Q3V3N8_MOUSE|nr:unnamed protein product [Mus musculus]
MSVQDFLCLWGTLQPFARFVLCRPRKGVLSGCKNTRTLLPSPRSHPTCFSSCHLKHLMLFMKAPNNFRESGAWKITSFQECASCHLTNERPVPPLLLITRNESCMARLPGCHRTLSSTLPCM